MFWHETNLTASDFVLIGLVANGIFGAVIMALNLLAHRFHYRNHVQIEKVLQELVMSLKEPKG